MTDRKYPVEGDAIPQETEEVKQKDKGGNNERSPRESGK